MGAQISPTARICADFKAPLPVRVKSALVYLPNPFQANSVTVPPAAVIAHAVVYGLLRRSVITTAFAVLPVLRYVASAQA
jgi:hypothetical protein